MSIKFIATDLDGTLMSPDHLTVSYENKRALKAAHNMGIKIAIATGRTLSFINDVVDQIPFVDYVIYSNGASVYDCNAKRDIYRNHIPASSTEEILKFLNSRNVYYTVYFNGRMYVQTDRIQFYQNNNGLPQKFIDEFSSKAIAVDDIVKSTIGMDSEIIAVYSMTDENKSVISKFLSDYELDLTSSLPGEIEGTIFGADKGKALDGVCCQLGINPSEVMTFGDAGNDAPMLEYASYSFAMENGTDACKRVAKYTAPSNADDGVAKMVEKFVLNY